jgi:hypothetical protein
VRSFFGASQRERASGQRQATAELGSILAAHPDLPCIAWTVAPAGPVLAGHVNGLAPADQVRQVFHSWRAALGLTEDPRPQTDHATEFLHACARRNQLTVRLTAAVFDQPPLVGL